MNVVLGVAARFRSQFVLNNLDTDLQFAEFTAWIS